MSNPNWKEAIPIVKTGVHDGNSWAWTIGSHSPVETEKQCQRAQSIASLYPQAFCVLRHEDDRDSVVLLCGTTSVAWGEETRSFIKNGESVVIYPDSSIVGYTHSDGYCLCVKHATRVKWDPKEEHYVREEIKDSGNESGHVFPIFDTEETDRDIICDPCHSEMFAKGEDVRDSILLEKNIMRRP